MAAPVWIISGWCTTLVFGVADCYLIFLPKGCRGLSPLCLATRRPIHSFIRGGVKQDCNDTYMF